MSRIYRSVSELIGNTPLLELCNIEKRLGLNSKIFAKLEYFNPAGSVKDRVAKTMIENAERCGRLCSRSVIIEPTSGNTGIGLAAVAAAKGYRTIIVMPDTMSVERRKLISAYGAEVILSDGVLGMQGAINKAQELAQSIENSFIPAQFANPDNPLTHFNTTGPEIWSDTDGDIDIFVAGVGTGGTITGVGQYLKKMKPSIEIVAVEPTNSPVLSDGISGKHAIQGIGAGFVPETLDTEVYDVVVKISDNEALEYSRLIASTEGVLVGISSGAALCAAVELAKRKENKGKKIVVLLPDTGERYLSTELFD